MVLYPNKLPESERVCSGICSQHKISLLICSMFILWLGDIPFKKIFLQERKRREKREYWA